MPSSPLTGSPYQGDETLTNPGLWADGFGQPASTWPYRPGPADQPVGTAGAPQW